MLYFWFQKEKLLNVYTVLSYNLKENETHVDSQEKKEEKKTPQNQVKLKNNNTYT